METTGLDRISYALGLSMGNNFKASGIKEIDFTEFAAGVEAVFAGTKPKMSYDEAKEVIRRFFTAMEERNQAEARKMADVNEKAGKDFLEQNGKRPEVKTTPSGLQYEILTEGTGAMPSASDQVKVHYTGMLIDGTVFDSSVERGEPATFGVTQVIPGCRSAADDESRLQVEALHPVVTRIRPQRRWRRDRSQRHSYLRCRAA